MYDRVCTEVTWELLTVRPKALTSKQKDRHDRRSLKAWLKVVEVRGIEPLAPCVQNKRIRKASNHCNSGTNLVSKASKGNMLD